MTPLRLVISYERLGEACYLCLQCAAGSVVVVGLPWWRRQQSSSKDRR